MGQSRITSSKEEK